MATGLERVAAKARSYPKLRFTSLVHHITPASLCMNLNKIPHNTSPGVDGLTVEETKKDFKRWLEQTLTSIHRQGYKAPPVKRAWIPKPGKKEKRPLGVPCINDRALQRSVADVLNAIYEQDFLPCSMGGRPRLGAHHALSTFNEVVSGRKVSWVLEADLKNFFGSLDHGWLLRFVEHRVGDPRILNLIRRWLKAGVMEAGELQECEEGTPQGGPISVVLSNLYLHYVLDLWFECMVKPRLKGEAWLIRYIDDFVVCFQYRSDAERFMNVLPQRLEKFALKLERDKTRLVRFGRFASRGGRRPETVYFLGFTHYCTRNLKGNFMVGRRTEKSRLRRSIAKLKELLRRIRHEPLHEQVTAINRRLRGHYAYYGLGGNFRSMEKLYRFVDRYWYKMLCSRCRKGKIPWEKYHNLKQLLPLQKPRIMLPFMAMKSMAVL
ncbi:group II intron reverse transcriptase/maturase [Endozoicomonas sp. ALD040]|uniref:group II intron reverse transcriptase/maturase n=1 Tax=Endozoicomonas sp. ALD040 TaxID=3403079 RepID=UPI003BAEA9CF